MAKTDNTSPKRATAKKSITEKPKAAKVKTAAEKVEQEEKSAPVAEVADITEHIEESGDSVKDSDGETSSDELLSAERDKYLRLAAEYDNFRKRSAKEREMTYNDARIDSITKLLPVYDNLERALQMECADEAFYKGIEMIMAQFNDMFENMGVKHIPAVGEPFDPNLHSAVMQITDPNLGANVVAEEYQKGFTLGERVIRFSTVVVAN
ncbi:MAG: nucleotide exchange factor GrpE [Oscillospiraceae bacterium]|nr:nucleotide exchange factor GrpE [Oscillospiraceae bacterium]